MAMEWKKVLKVIGLLGLCFFIVPIKVNRTDVSEQEELFSNFIKKFNKTYGVGSEEYTKRFKNFQV